MADIQIKTFDVLPQELNHEFEQIKHICFDKGNLTPEEKKLRDDKYCSQQDKFRYYVAFLEGKLIASVTLFKREVSFDKGKIVLGGIGGVCTLPEMRKKGIATEVLTMGMDGLKETKCDVAYLCTNIHTLGKFYGKFGFVALNKQYTFTGKSGKQYLADDGMIAPVESEKIFSEILNSKEIFDIGKGNW